jgi:dihydrodipicolinate synthase/N-acetylneuraminate lyase
MFEVFDDSTNRSTRVLRALDAHGVTAVVLSAPSFSPPITPEMFAQLAIRYPHAQYVGPFQLRWRD